MKITIIVSGFPPKYLAGTEVATYNIAKCLAKRGHEVHVITSLDEGTQREEIKEGFYLHRIKLHSRVPIASIMIYFMEVASIIKRINPDIIHCQNLGMGWMAYVINFFKKHPYVIYGRGDDVYADYWLKEFLLGLTIKNADAVITLTEDMKQEASKVYERDIYVVPNGIYLDNYKEKSSNTTLFNYDKKVLLYVGRLKPIKGVRYLINAMAIVNQNCPNTKLLIVGDGDERNNLEQLVENYGLNDCITFVGRVSNEDVPKYLTNADIFVLPSLSEGFPNVILEAMASGLPVVATNIRGMSEIIAEETNGYLVESKNSEQLAVKIISLLNDAKLMKAMSENNVICAKQYEWRNVVKKLENIYLKCIRF